jgi:hypothetical protein
LMIIYFAGMEAFPYCAEVAENVLGSFLYKDKCDILILEHKYKTLMIDSGAHSFFEAAKGKRGTRDMPDPDTFIHNYCKWLVKNKGKINYYVELDLDKLTGWKKQLEMRQVFDTYNLNPLIVWHPTNRITIEEMANKYDYFGIGSTYIMGESTIRKILETVHKYKSKVHIFGYTRFSELPRIGALPALFSVDSTSWIGTKYGQVYHTRTTKPKVLALRGKKLGTRNLLIHNIIQFKKVERKLSLQQESNAR